MQFINSKLNYMKKFLLSLVALIAFAGYASADEVTFDFTTNQYGHTPESGNSSNYLEDNTVITEGVISVTTNKLTGSGVRFWESSGNITFRVMKNSGITVSINGGTISEIEMTGTNIKNFKVGDVALTDNKWTGSEASVAMINSGSTVQIKTLKVTYTGGTVDTRKEAGMSFPEEKYTATLGQPFEAPVLIKATNAAVTYKSDKESVATVDAATGAVTLVGEGTARITASAEANDEYKAGSASYLLTVEPAPIEGALLDSPKGVDFTFENPEGLDVWSHDNTYGLKGSAFISGKVNAAVAYAVSPVVDLTGKKNVTLDFQQAFNNYKENNVMIDVANFKGYAEVVVREEGATEWTKLADVTAPEAFSWKFYANATISLDAYKGKKVQIGFKYVSTETVAGTWEVNKIVVMGDEDSAISEIEATEAPAEYYNLQGVRVANPGHGLYIVKQGNKVSKVVM